MTEIAVLLHRCGISEAKAAERARSVLAAVSLARTNRLRRAVYEKGERLLATTAWYAAGRGTTTRRTHVLPIGTTTTGSGLSAHSLAAMDVAVKPNASCPAPN